MHNCPDVGGVLLRPTAAVSLGTWVARGAATPHPYGTVSRRSYGCTQAAPMDYTIDQHKLEVIIQSACNKSCDFRKLMMRAHLRLNQVGTAIFSHKHTPPASHPAIQQVPLSSTTQQKSLHTQIMSHSLAKSKGTAMTDLVPPKLSWVYILSSMFNVSSMFNGVVPTQPPTMATSLQPINGTAKPTYCHFNQQRYGYHTSTMDAQCLANTITNSGKYSTSCATNSPGYGSYTHHPTCNLKSTIDLQSLCADEVLESKQLRLNPPAKPPLHSCIEYVNIILLYPTALAKTTPPVEILKVSRHTKYPDEISKIINQFLFANIRYEVV